MNKYSGTIILTILFVLLGYAILQTLPPKTVSTEFGEIPVLDNQSYPLASISNPECQFNNADLFLIQPKVYQSVSKGSLNIVGQAVGAFENNVVVELTNESGDVLSGQPVTVESEYPCAFETTIGVGTVPEGTYTVRARFNSPSDGSIVRQVEVPIRIE